MVKTCIILTKTVIWSQIINFFESAELIPRIDSIVKTCIMITKTVIWNQIINYFDSAALIAIIGAVVKGLFWQGCHHQASGTTRETTDILKPISSHNG